VLKGYKYSLVGYNDQKEINSEESEIGMSNGIDKLGQLSQLCSMPIELTNSNLLQTQSFIGGVWTKGEYSFPVYNPSNAEVLCEVESIASAQIDRAIENGANSFHDWKRTLAKNRSALLMKWFHLVQQNEKDLANILTLEQGKPFGEALGEIRYGAGFIEWFAQEAVRVDGDILQPTHDNRRMHVIKQAVGLVGAITPWNFPNAMITRKIAPALAAGCAVVLKPSEETPLSALALAYLAKEAGIPDGVFNVIVSQDPTPIGERFTNHPDIRKLTFTGSTAVGRLLAQKASANLKRISLELGGNAPFIVCEDANIQKAVETFIATKYRNNGQTCICANRILLHSSVSKKFIEYATNRISEIKVGDGMKRGINAGPLINSKAKNKVRSLLNNALENGGKLEIGGEFLEGNFMQPTLVSGGLEKMECFRKEIFGPLAVSFEFNSDKEALEMANKTEYGLAAYVATESLSRSFHYSENLDFGMVGINTAVISDPSAPFGGVKNSGQGREGSKYGIDEFLIKKFVSMELE